MFDRPARGPSRPPAITKRDVSATVKWFNPSKGFGFVTPDDGSPDAFLHANVLQAIGHDTLPDGATILCDLAQGPKGPQVAVVHNVDTSTASAGGGMRGGGADRGGPPRRSGGYGRDRDEAYDGAEEVVEGTVKWFNEAKGFGFIAPENGRKDIFVHVSALGRSGLTSLTEGTPVRVTVRQGVKGPEAARLEII